MERLRIFTMGGLRLVRGDDLVTGLETVRVYTMEYMELTALAMQRLTRWFTPDECKQLLHQETCPAR